MGTTDDGEDIFDNRAKERVFTKAEVLSTEELTNYTARCALAFRHTLGFTDTGAAHYPLPERPPIPAFLRSYFPKNDQR